MLAMISLAVVFGCYFPHVATSLGATNPWRIASTVFLLVPLSILFHQAWLNRHGVPAGTNRAVAGLLATIMLASVVVLSLVVLGFASSNAPGLYLLAALLVLLDASVLFVRLLVTSFRGGAPAAQQGVEPDVE
jgi:quinol-cytochrome oxidoreductase complex cytochrome b subunit